MRLLARLATLAALAALAFAAQAAWQARDGAPGAGTSPLPLAENILGGEGRLGNSPVESFRPERGEAPKDRLAQDTSPWPALFGESLPPQPPAPEPPAPEPQSPQPPAPPVASLGYTLKGVVRDGGATWALVSHPAGDRVLRVGDALGDDYAVSRIDAGGLWLRRTGAPGGEEVLMEFAE